MLYYGKDMDLKEYFTTRMKELGFYDENGQDKGLESVDGYYKNEAECNIIMDYESSCLLDKQEDRDFIDSLDFYASDFDCRDMGEER